MLKKLLQTENTREGKDLTTENKPKAIKKMVIRSYILIITLNVNGLNAPTKRQTGWLEENMCMYALPLTASFFLTPPQIMSLFYIVKLIMFPLWLVIIIVFYFLSGY